MKYPVCGAAEPLHDKRDFNEIQGYMRPNLVAGEQWTL